MNTKKVCAFLFILFCIVSISGCAVRTTPPPGTILDGKAVRDVLQHGDWLVTRGIEGTDNAVVILTRLRTY